MMGVFWGVILYVVIGDGIFEEGFFILVLYGRRGGLGVDWGSGERKGE